MGLSTERRENVGAMLGRLETAHERVMPEFLACEEALLAMRLDKYRGYSATRFASLSELARMGHPYARRERVNPTTGRLARLRYGVRLRRGFPAVGGRRARPPAPPWFINLQSGELRRSWRGRMERGGGRVFAAGVGGTSVGRGAGDIVTVVENRARYASFVLEGTKYMIARPIARQVLADLRNVMRRRRAEAARRILGPASP